MSAKHAHSGAGGPDTSFECPVCLDDFHVADKTNSITCGCGTTACLDCVKTHLLHASEDPHCLKCKRAWDRSTQYEYLGAKFVNGPYRKKRKARLLSLEKQKLPETMAILAAEKEAARLRTEGKQQLQVLTTNWHQKRRHIEEERNAKLAEITRQYDTKLRTHDKKHLPQINLLRAKVALAVNGGVVKSKSKLVFTSGCPDGDCRGFLGVDNKCGLCEKFACGKCLKILGDEPTDDDHECNADDVATVKMMKKTTRSCPKCATPIFKISGCDQMWCTQCHVAFSWATGKIVTNGRLHNPHYYAYIQKHGEGAIRAPEEVVCGGLPDAREVLHRIRWSVEKCLEGGKGGKERAKMDVESLLKSTGTLMKAHRFASHLSDIILRDLRRETVRDIDIVDHRKRFLRGEIDEKGLARIIAQRENVRAKNTEIMRVLEITNTVMVENFNTFMSVEKAILSVWGDRVLNLMASLEAIRKYSNTEMKKISVLFKMTVPLIVGPSPKVLYKVNAGRYPDKDMAWSDISVKLTAKQKDMSANQLASLSKRPSFRVLS